MKLQEAVLTLTEKAVDQAVEPQQNAAFRQSLVEAVPLVRAIMEEMPAGVAEVVMELAVAVQVLLGKTETAVDLAEATA
jgi:hypothetical protein